MRTVGEGVGTSRRVPATMATGSTRAASRDRAVSAEGLGSLVRVETLGVTSAPCDAVAAGAVCAGGVDPLHAARPIHTLNTLAR